ncbi:MAG: hypothetical protein ACRDO4_08235, partial [Nocardioides sp.]
MMAGANEQKLREHLASSRVSQVLRAESQWADGARALAAVEDAIEGARPLAKKNLGQHTADQADKAFVAMRDKVKERRQQLNKGAAALGEAKGAIDRAQAVVNGFDSAGPLNEPSSPDWSDDEVQQIQQLKVHGAKMTAYSNALAAREEAAQAAIQDVDTTNHSSTNVMREIQGKPPVDNGGGSGSGTPGGGGGSVPPSGGTPPRHYDPPRYDSGPRDRFEPVDGGPLYGPTYEPPPYEPPTEGTYEPPPIGEPPTDGPGEETDPGSPTAPAASSGSFGGMAALGGGLAGGAIGMGAI